MLVVVAKLLVLLRPCLAICGGVGRKRDFLPSWEPRVCGTTTSIKVSRKTFPALASAAASAASAAASAVRRRPRPVVRGGH